MNALISVLIVTGGHDFERAAFFAMFDSFTGIEYQEAQHPGANASYIPEVANNYDVFVFYDMNQEISEEQKTAFITMLKRGKGVLFLHHALGSYQAWDEFEKIIGGRYHMTPYEQDGKQFPASTYRHDVEIPVTIADVKHPVTEGMSEFIIHDEVYGGFTVLPTVHPLLTTTHPESGPTIAWTHTYGNSRIVTIQLGHDRQAYENPSYRKLILNAIRWVAENP
ncbi:MAG: ThuA domain-containing protein [Candidatus Zipacnadales bacterium]